MLVDFISWKSRTASSWHPPRKTITSFCDVLGPDNQLFQPENNIVPSRKLPVNMQAVQRTEVKLVEMEIKSDYNNGLRQNKTDEDMNEH